MAELGVEVEAVERDIPCRGWEIKLFIKNGDERGWYTFFLTDSEWRKVRDNPVQQADSHHEPTLFVEGPGEYRDGVGVTLECEAPRYNLLETSGEA